MVMKLFCHIVIWLILLQLLFLPTDTGRRNRRLRHKSKNIQKSLKQIPMTEAFNTDALKVVLRYCKAKDYWTVKFDDRCIKRTHYELDLRCTHVRRKKKKPAKNGKQFCTEYVERLLMKTENWDKQLSESRKVPAQWLRSGKQEQKTQIKYKADCRSLFQPSVVYDPSVSICCGGNILPRYNVANDCCNATRPSVCCLSCCNDTVFNRTTHFCYGGQLFKNETLHVKQHVKPPLTSAFEVSTTYRNTEQVDTYDGLNDAVVDDEGTLIPTENFLVVLIVISVFSGVALLICSTIITRQRYRTLAFCRGLKSSNVPLELKLPRPEHEAETSFSASAPSELVAVRSENSGYATDAPTELGKSFNSVCNKMFVTAQVTNSLTHEVDNEENVERIGTACSPEPVDQSSQDQDSLYSEISVIIEDLPITEVLSLKEGTTSADQFTRNFLKESKIADHNLTENQWKTVDTQTVCIMESNMRDSLGRPFQGQYLKTVNDRVVQLPHSDVVMTLPGKDLQENAIECHVSSLTDIGNLRHKLKIADQEIVVSPIFECVLQGVPKLKEHAVVKLPICSHSSKMRILRAVSNQGAHEVFDEIYDVPRMSASEEGNSLDTFYILSESKQFVFIYTKVFSIYLNVDTREKLDFQAHCYAFGGIQKCEKKAMMTIALYIAGGLSSFRDYDQKMVEDERCAGRKQIEKRKLKFRDTLKSTDQLEVDLDIADIEKWGFGTHEGKKKRVSARDVVQCQQQNGFQYTQLCWEIENQGSSIPPTFKCSVKINQRQDIDVDAVPDEVRPLSGEEVCHFTIIRPTKDRRRESSRSSISSYRSSYSTTESQMSTLEESRPTHRVDQVRKELDTSMQSSYYDSSGKKIRPPHILNPAPELSKVPDCSFDKLETEAVRKFSTTTL